MVAAAAFQAADKQTNTQTDGHRRHITPPLLRYDFITCALNTRKIIAALKQPGFGSFKDIENGTVR